MSQDDGSDSEPELVVQSKGHWEKNLGVRGWRTREIIGVWRLVVWYTCTRTRAGVQIDHDAVGAAGLFLGQPSNCFFSGGFHPVAVLAS